MKRILLAAALAAAAATPAAAAVTTLDFSGYICGPNGTAACVNGSQVFAGYGDSDVLDVEYRAINTVTGKVIETYARTWTGYGDLSGVAYAGGGTASMLEIFLKPKAGYEVSLLDFDFSTYQGRVPNVPIKILSGAGDLIADLKLSTKAPTHNSLAVNSDFFRSGVILRFGPNGYDAAVDNLRFDVRRSATPEPGAWALMLLGFGGLGAMLRRRRAWAVA